MARRKGSRRYALLHFHARVATAPPEPLSATLLLHLLFVAEPHPFESLLKFELKKAPTSNDKGAFLLARRKGFEPLAFGSVDRRYIQLS